MSGARTPLPTAPADAGAPPGARQGAGTSARARLLAAAAVCGAVLLLALLLAGGAPVPSVAGLPDAGPGTGWALPVVQLVLHAAAVSTIGPLLLAAVLLPGRPAGLSVPATGAVRCASWSAGLWSVSSVLLWVLTVSETVGVPVSGLVPQHLADHVASGQGRAPLLVAVVGAAVAYGCSRARTTAGAGRLLLLAGSALVPVTVTGHASATADHELAVSSLVVHVVAAAAWAGGLLAILVFVRRPAQLAPVVARFSVVALACFVLVALSGLLSAYERLGLSAATWTSGYGGLVLVKTAAMAVLGAMGWWHRRRLVPALAAGRPGAFLSFAGVELSVLAGTFALAVALSRTPTPATSVPAAPVASHGAGHATLPTTVEPVSLTTLLLEWRVDAVVLAAAGLLAVSYLAGVRRLRAAGTSWPRHRSAAFAGAVSVAVLALCSGVATYAAAMLSVQVAQFLVLLVGVPALLVLGAPLTLLRRVRDGSGTAPAPDEQSPRPVPRLLTDPLVGMGLVAGLVFVVYRTGLLERSSGSAGLTLVVHAATLAVGCLLMGPALGAAPPLPVRSSAERAVPLVAAAASLLVLAAELRSDQLLAGRWFVGLGWAWVDPAADQRLAALIAAGGALLVLVLAAAVWRAPLSASPALPDPYPHPDAEPREAVRR